MFEPVVKKVVDHQIDHGILPEEDRNIYRYGYQMLIEFCINIMTSVVIAVLFHAGWIVLVFTLAFLLIRGYAGGFHARTSLGCFVFSACMLIAVIFTVKFAVNADRHGFVFLSEIVMLPLVFKGTPIPAVNKPITENERTHFSRKVKQLYFVELAAELLLWWFGKGESALAVLAVHAVLFIMVLADTIYKCREKFRRKIS